MTPGGSTLVSYDKFLARIAPLVTQRRKLALWWRRTGMAARVGIFALLACVLAFLVYSQRPQEDSPNLGHSLVVFLLVNLNIALLCVLAFLIGRNIVKLIFDRRRNILGSKLRLRLVTAFVGLTIIPTAFLFLLASGLLTRAMEGWFSEQVEASVGGAVEVAKYHYATLKESSLSAAERLVREARAGAPLGDKTALLAWLEERRKEERLFAVRIFSEPSRELAEVHNAAAVIPTFAEPEPNAGALQKAFGGEEGVLFEENEASQFVRAYVPAPLGGRTGALIATIRISPEISQALAAVNDSYTEYERRKVFRAPVKSGYFLTLSMITGLIVFAAIWIGFYIAKELVVPIQKLAEGTRAVARGDYDFHIRAGGDDELALLVKSFNTMTSDLKQSRAEAEGRRLYIEAILGNLAVGVIGLDTKGVITSVNGPAARLFGIQDSEGVRQRPIREVMRPQDLEQILPLIEQFEADASEVRSSERELSIESSGTESKVLCTVGPIKSQSGEVIGIVLLFDDITELSKAQHMAAWREVARRIAHEIKNPLTPIQLSAQRLQKLLPELHAPPSVSEAAGIIVENVASIKRLANEFSNFARMPTAEFRSSDINSLIAAAIAPFAESHSDIVFQFIPDTRIPELMLDREQIRRVIINLIDNAIGALSKEGDRSPFGGEGARIVIRTSFDFATRMVAIEVSDNGPGVPGSDKVRIFEPYFTTKAGGSGLGLAIVTSIVSDHQGQIRVFDNRPRGARFVVELPAQQRATTQRRLA